MKGIIFDCFGVLYLNPGLHFYETYVPDYEQLRPQLDALGREVDYGLITQAEMVQGVADLTGLDAAFVGQNIHGVHRRNERLLTYARSLRLRYKVGMLSNIGVGEMDSFFSPKERRELFDAVVLSGEEGITKPHPHIYEMMAERLGVPVGECVMIDDLVENCAGADAAGMKTVRFLSNAQAIRDIENLL